MHWFEELDTNVLNEDVVFVEDVIAYLSKDHEVHEISNNKMIVESYGVDIIIRQIILKVDKEYLVIESDLGIIVNGEYSPVDSPEVNGIYQAISKRIRRTEYVAVDENV